MEKEVIMNVLKATALLVLLNTTYISGTYASEDIIGTEAARQWSLDNGGDGIIYVTGKNGKLVKANLGGSEIGQLIDTQTINGNALKEQKKADQERLLINKQNTKLISAANCIMKKRNTSQSEVFAMIRAIATKTGRTLEDSAKMFSRPCDRNDK